MTDVVLPAVPLIRGGNCTLAKRAAVNGEFGIGNAADGLIKPLEDGGTSAIVKADSLEPPSCKMLSLVKRSSYEPESHAPPSNEAVKMVVRAKDTQGLGEEQRHQGQLLTLAEQAAIKRMGSAAESLVDSWSPDLLRTKSTQNPYDTAPYSDTAEEQPTVRLGRPLSKRGNLPIFAELPRDEGGPDDEDNGLDGNNPAALSPIYSVCHSTLDCNAPISLDDLREGPGMFATNEYNAERTVVSALPGADTRSDIRNEDDQDDGDHIVSGDEKSLSNRTHVGPARLVASASVNSERFHAEATDASVAAQPATTPPLALVSVTPMVAATTFSSDGEGHGEGDASVGEQLSTDERDVKPAPSPVPAFVHGDGVRKAVDESASRESAALLLVVDSAATSVCKDIASCEDEGHVGEGDSRSNKQSPCNERGVEPASPAAPTSANSDNVRVEPTDTGATGELPASTPFVHSAAKSAADSSATYGTMNGHGKNDLGASNPFFFDGTSNKHMTAMLGSPAVSMKSMKSYLVSPALSALGKGAIITDDGLSCTDANHSAIWAAAAAAAHARNRSHIPLSEELRSMSRTSAGDPKSENVSKLRQALQLIGLFKNTPRVAPGRVNRPPPGPDSNALPELPTTGRHDIALTPVKFRLPEFVSATPSAAGTPSKPSVVGPEKPAPFAGGLLGKTPLPSPTGNGSDEDTAGDTSTTASSSPGGLATARVEVEGDLEEGGTPASGGRAAVAAEAATAASARVATDSAVRAAVADHQMVLPCAPSDDEKVMYYKTGRFGVVALSLLSFYTLSVGMWLFVIVTPAFYWFGVPAAFLMFYLACHYFGVAVWGTDFRPGVHENILRRSRDAGYEPTVDVFLPVCREPTFLLANTWKYVSALDYPRVSVHVLDDGACDQVRDLAAEFGFNYIVRDNRPELKKAGNLRNAFTHTSGEAIAIFDADFCPRPDFLKETIPYFGQFPAIGILQTPQFFRYREEQTWIEKGAGVTQEFFYRLVQVNQDKFGAAVCVGSCGLYRRAALEPFGGVAAIAHSEDMYTGYKMTEHGYTIKYLPLNLAMGACPDEPQTFFMQQYRWCMGSACLVTEKEFWKSNISNIHKLCFVNGLLYYVATALLVFVAPIPILLLVWMKADGVLWYHSVFAIPSILFAAIVMPCWAKQKYGMACHRVKIIQCYAHMYAIKDRIMGRSAPWVPSGVGASTASVTYKSSIRLLVAWNIVITVMIVGGSAWRMTEHTWYHFVPAIVLAAGSFVLNMSTLIY